MGKSAPRCDSCLKRIRQNHHELVLSDALTGQEVGHYHTRPGCQQAAMKYLTSGAVLVASYHHPARCGDDLENCDGGSCEAVA
jgi:hypothetical protein